MIITKNNKLNKKQQKNVVITKHMTKIKIQLRIAKIVKIINKYLRTIKIMKLLEIHVRIMKINKKIEIHQRIMKNMKITKSIRESLKSKTLLIFL